MKIGKATKLSLALIIFLAFVLRLYKIDIPLADWHSWRQADTASVSRTFLQEGFDLLHPRYHDLSNIPSGRENPQGYRFVEFPLYNFFHAGLAKLFPQIPLVVWGRLVSIFSSLAAIIFLFFLTHKYLGPRIALFSALFYAILPYSIYYGRVILPEPMMVASSLAMLYFFDKWLERAVDKGNKGYRGEFFGILAAVLAAVSFLLKPYALFLGLPMLYLVWRKYGIGFLFKGKLWLFAFASIVSLIAWRVWSQQFPEGIPAYSWLFNKDNIRFKGAFFRWIFAERLGKLILGYWGLVPLGFGLAAEVKKREGWFFFVWLAAILAYVTILAGGNVTHDYYQIMAIPIVAIFLAKGVDFLLSLDKNYLQLITSRLLLIASIAFMLAFSWFEVRGFYQINHPEIVEAGEAADRLLPPEAKVIAPYGGDTAFLYQTNRRGWPAVTTSINQMIELGATHYVSTKLDETTLQLIEEYNVILKTEEFVIVELRTKQ